MLEDLTVICCAYNAQNTIHSAISSVLDNLNQGMKLIVINDCSTDYTRDIVLDFNHPNINLIDNEYNMGVGYSKNIAMDNVQTNYFGFLDADDWVYNTYFNSLLWDMKNRKPDVDVILALSYVRVVGNERTLLSSMKDVKITKDKDDFVVLDNFVGDISTSSYIDLPLLQLGIYNTTFINNHNIRCAKTRSAEDRLFFWNIIKANAKILLSKEFSYFYDKSPNPNSLSQTTDSYVQLGFIETYKDILESIRETKNKNYIDKVIRQVVALIDFHSKKEEYSKYLLEKLYIKSSKLVKSFTEEEFDFVYSTVNESRKNLLTKLLEMKDED